jgi:hypothetical protein
MVAHAARRLNTPHADLLQEMQKHKEPQKQLVSVRSSVEADKWRHWAFWFRV